jgi:DNA polymerase I-like protein with 3'-5' exonuclease and polymerase domains
MQTVAATGRLGSNKSGRNIPIRTRRGQKNQKEAFIARDEIILFLPITLKLVRIIAYARVEEKHDKSFLNNEDIQNQLLKVMFL